jgi:ribosomal protein S18 acetylase RimI-like enzyme
MQVWTVTPTGVESIRPALCEILIDCVRHGASVGFLDPLGRDEADAYWRGIGRAVTEGRSVLLAAALDGGGATGTVQLDVDTLPNQPHRATVGKLLVHTSVRRQGMGEALMAEVE